MELDKPVGDSVCFSDEVGLDTTAGTTSREEDGMPKRKAVCLSNHSAFWEWVWLIVLSHCLLFR